MKASPVEIVWNARYATGVADVDEQHRALLAILNQLNAAAARDLSAKKTHGLLWEKFAELNEYAAYHFLTEEKLMREHMPTATLTARHIAAHRNYWVTVGAFKDRARQDEAQVIGELGAFLNSWWIEHILGTDIEMGRELNNKGVR